MRRPFAVLFVLALINCLPVGLSSSLAQEEEEDFVPIFNGEDLSGWDGDPRFWSVEEGAITGQTTAENPTSGNTFLNWSQGSVDDFVLKLQYRIESGNSGIQYRSVHWPDRQWNVGGYQADIDSGNAWTGILWGENDRGIMAERGQRVAIGDDHKPELLEQFADAAELVGHIKTDDWNDYEIIVRGNHIVHKINGQVMVDVTDDDETGRRMSGILALQLHQGPPMKVQFRDIRLRRLPLEDGRKKLVFIAGTGSHGYMAHEFNAGSLLLQNCLDGNVPELLSVVYQNGWPQDPTALANADGICIFCDGGEGHPANEHLEELQELMDQGVGLACLHYGVEVPKGEPGDRFVDWIGGYFETDWSVNPHWTLEQTQVAEDHSVTRGVEAFAINDEWYYHMRFRDEMEGVTALLTAVPPASTLSRPNGPHSGNDTVRDEVARGLPQAVAWANERTDGGRGFGYTGAHWHWNWAQDDNRKLVLNSLVWISGLDVPAGGVDSATPTLEELEANQDYDPSGEWTGGKREEIEALLGEWAAE